jgi:hypothetical protein
VSRGLKLGPFSGTTVATFIVILLRDDPNAIGLGVSQLKLVETRDSLGGGGLFVGPLALNALRRDRDAVLPDGRPARAAVTS